VYRSHSTAYGRGMKLKAKKSRAIYHHEKKRANEKRGAKHEALMKDAQAVFDRMMEDAKAARKGGRPKGSTSKKG